MNIFFTSFSPLQCLGSKNRTSTICEVVGIPVLAVCDAVGVYWRFMMFQVAVLCQFLDEIDYTIAFKALQERCTHDAVDAYYDCIWDTSMLEFLISILFVAHTCITRDVRFVSRYTPEIFVKAFSVQWTS